MLCKGNLDGKPADGMRYHGQLRLDPHRLGLHVRERDERLADDREDLHPSFFEVHGVVDTPRRACASVGHGADDEIGLVLFVGDLDVYTLSALADPNTGLPSSNPSGRWLKKVSQITQPRFAAPSVRHQIGSVVASYSADSAFVVIENGRIRKVRGEDLTKGMVLATGEKVFW